MTSPRPLPHRNKPPNGTERTPARRGSPPGRASRTARGPGRHPDQGGPRRGSRPGRASRAARGPGRAAARQPTGQGVQGGTRTGAGRGAAARRAGRPGRHADQGGRGTAGARGRIVAGAATRLLCSAARNGRAMRSAVRASGPSGSGKPAQAVADTQVGGAPGTGMRARRPRAVRGRPARHRNSVTFGDRQRRRPGGRRPPQPARVSHSANALSAQRSRHGATGLKW